MSLVKFDVTRSSSKWVLGDDGYLKEFTSNFPAFEFNADGSYRGVLVESQSTNLIPHSEDISNPEWDDYDVTITTNQVIAPDGTLTADKVNFSASNNARIAEAITTSAGTYTFSFWIRTVTGNGNFRMAFFTAGKPTNTSTFSVSEQWKRVSMTYSHDASSTLLCYLGYYINTAYVQEVYFWGAQLELSPIATSYIPTTTGTATRAADIITLDSASQYLPPSGKLTLGWEQKENDTIYIGPLSASISSGVRKLEFEYSSSYQKLYIDDTLIQSVTGNFDFSGMDKIELGHLSGSDHLNTNLKYLAIE